MNSSIHVIDYAIIIGIFAGMLFLGFRFSKQQKTTGSFFLAKGRIPTWAIGLSLLSTLISSVTFLAYPGNGYASNWLRLVQGLMVPIVLLGVIWFIVPLFRRVIRLSTYEYFEQRFGGFARYYTSVAFVLRQISGMGTVLFLLAVALNNIIGGDMFLVVFLVGALIIIVNLVGGIEAVIWLDVFQGFMLFASGIICLGILLFSTQGGPAEIYRVASESGRTGFGPYDADFTRMTFLVMVINGAFYAVQKYGTDQTVVQRYLTAKTDKSAIRASLMGILLTVPIWTIFMFIGTALFVFYQQNPLPEGLRPEAVFPYFIKTRLPVGVTGLILSAMISAAVCSLSAELNSLAAVGVEDYYKKLRPNRTDRHYLAASRWLVLASGVITILIGLLYVNAGSEGVLGIIFDVYAIFSGGIVGIFILGLFVPRANRRGITIGIIACILFTAYAFLTSTRIGLGEEKHLLVDLGAYNFPHDKLMVGVYSHLVMIAVGYVASLFFPAEAVDPKLLYSGRKTMKEAEALETA
jgi:solute:Na+ symporter, SSS family